MRVGRKFFLIRLRSAFLWHLFTWSEKKINFWNWLLGSKSMLIERKSRWKFMLLFIWWEISVNQISHRHIFVILDWCQIFVARIIYYSNIEHCISKTYNCRGGSFWAPYFARVLLFCTVKILKSGKISSCCAFANSSPYCDMWASTAFPLF